MDDERQKRENAIFAEEKEKLQQQQAERNFLKDRSIGGQNAPRPTDDFIERSLGKDQNRQQMAVGAGKKTDERMAREDAQARDRDKHQHDARKDKQQGQSTREMIAQKRENERKRGRSR